MLAHPLLAAMLAEWKLTGWTGTFARAPGPDDLILPVTPRQAQGAEQGRAGSMRDRHYTWKRAQRDLDALGLRRRRVHDLRRTGITLARGDGADRDILRRGTHAPPRDVMELYTSVEWAKLCAEVAKLGVERHRAATVVALHADVEEHQSGAQTSGATDSAGHAGSYGRKATAS